VRRLKTRDMTVQRPEAKIQRLSEDENEKEDEEEAEGVAYTVADP